VTDATNLTLVKPWSGPTISGLPFEIYRPIYMIGDVSGVETDGVGGTVRLTGRDDDTTDPGVHNRTDGFQLSTDDYWHIRGFTITNFSDRGYEVLSCDMVCIEDTVGIDIAGTLARLGDPSRITVRRAVVLGGYDTFPADIRHSAAVDNSQCLVENMYAHTGRGIYVDQVGGITVKNLTMGFENQYALSVNNLQTGNSVFLHDNLIHFCSGTDAVTASGAGMVIETLNNYWQNNDDLHANVSGGVVAAPDTQYCHLPMLPSLIGRVRQPMTFFAPSEWEPTRYATGLYPKNEDLFGVQNEVAQTRRSWGAIHAHAVKRSTTQVYDAFTGSLYMEDASEQQFVFPVQAGLTYTLSAQVYIEVNYTGNVPDLTVRQPGQTDVVATASGAAGVWEQLSATMTVGADMDWLHVALASHNTSAVPAYGVYWNNIQITR
jgi:hypothetical protein